MTNSVEKPTQAADNRSPSEARRLRVGVVGTGALGRHHVRILSEMPAADLVGIYDQTPEVAGALAEKHNTVSMNSLEELADQVEAVVLAVPTYAHARLGCTLLERGLHLLVEKPMASSLEESDQLLAVAGDQVLAVGHVEFYNPAVQALLAVNEPARYLEVQRLSPFTPRSLDVDVILDLMIHDLQLLHALDPSPVKEIRATGIEVLSARIDMVTARVELESGLVANITASRVASEVVRKLRAYLASRYFSLDYRDQEIKGFGLEEQGEKRLIVPQILPVKPCEPLRAELDAFVGACLGQDVSYVDGHQGRRALETALAVRQEIV
jgi:predicted dehydrogenase